jgi:hypothetical protein
MDRVYNLKTLVDKLQSDVIGKWHNEGRSGNDGSAGNTIEDLLGISENNLKLPDWGRIEIKTKKKESQSLVTLLHREPSPAASIPKLLTSLGWRHQNAGGKYPADEMSFRSTTRADSYSDRGFAMKLHSGKIEFIFDPAQVSVDTADRTGTYATYGDWLADVQKRQPHYSEVLPVYWDRQYVETEIRDKLDHTLLLVCDTRKNGDVKQFKYVSAVLQKGFRPDRMDELFAAKSMYVDFDARTRHNHGTKFRIGLAHIPKLFDESITIF